MLRVRCLVSDCQLISEYGLRNQGLSLIIFAVSLTFPVTFAQMFNGKRTLGYMRGADCLGVDDPGYCVCPGRTPATYRFRFLGRRIATE